MMSTSAKNQIEFLAVDNEKIEKNFVSIYLKKDHFASLVVTDKYSMKKDVAKNYFYFNKIITVNQSQNSFRSSLFSVISMRRRKEHVLFDDNFRPLNFSPLSAKKNLYSQF